MTLFHPPIRGCLSCYRVYTCPVRLFHATSWLKNSDAFPNHYETLGLRPDATAGEIKKYGTTPPPMQDLGQHKRTEVWTHDADQSMMQTILRPLQKVPPRSLSRSRRVSKVRANQRGIPRPWILNEAFFLRSRLRADPQPHIQARFTFVPHISRNRGKIARRRPTRKRSEQAKNTVQRSAAELLQRRRLRLHLPLHSSSIPSQSLL
jgi:hypothetical protein